MENISEHDFIEKIMSNIRILEGHVNSLPTTPRDIIIKDRYIHPNTIARIIEVNIDEQYRLKILILALRALLVPNTNSKIFTIYRTKFLEKTTARLEYVQNAMQCKDSVLYTKRSDATDKVICNENVFLTICTELQNDIKFIDSIIKLHNQIRYTR